MFEVALMSFAGGALFGERFGTGPPRVLALHGWGRRGSDFAPSLSGMDALALDLPGFGASPPPDRADGAAGYAERIRIVLDDLEAPPVVVGHSFGARVAVSLADRHPVAGLVLVGAPLVRSAASRSRPSLRYRVVRAAAKANLVGQHRLERLRQEMGSADYRAADGVMRQVLVRAVNESYEGELARATVPVHLLWGGDDKEVPVMRAREALAILEAAEADAHLEVVDGAGHHLPLQAPEALRRAVEAMLKRVAP